MAGEGSAPLVDGAALELDSVATQEALTLTVVWEVVAVFVADDLADELRAAEGAGERGVRGGTAERWGLGSIFADEFGDASDAPIGLRSGDFELAVFAHFDLAKGVGVGFDFIGNGFVNNDAFEPAGIKLVFAAALFLRRALSFSFLGALRFTLLGGGGGFGLSQLFFSKWEVFLGGVVTLGLFPKEFPKELLPVVFVELEGGGESLL